MREEAPDLALAIAASHGNTDAFGELARRYRRAAVRIAASIAGPDKAEDIVQDALLLAFRSIAHLDEPDCFGPWLAAITRNRALRVARQDDRIPRIEWDAVIESHLKEIADSDQRNQAAASDLASGIDTLPPDLALAMRLRWLDEMPLNRIAVFTGLPVSTIKWRLYQGRKILRAWARTQLKGDQNNHGNKQRTTDSKTDGRPAPNGENSSDEPMDGPQRRGRPSKYRPVQPHPRSASAGGYDRRP